MELNRDWTFTETFNEAFLKGEVIPGLKEIELPHTCRETPFHYFDESIYQMVCGYRRFLSVPHEWEGKRVILRVGAAGHSAKVYVNGTQIAEHYCGYTAFSAELTDHLIPGQEALLVIRVDSREDQDIPPFGNVIDYMTYGGLYREVWLDIKEQSYIEDVYAMPSLSGELKTQVKISGDPSGLSIRQRVSDGDRVLAEDTFPAGSDTLLFVRNVVPWEINAPKLYQLETCLQREDQELDTRITRIGFRDAVFQSDGFYLNGRKIKLRGLNRHQSYPYIGYAAPASLQRYDADLLKTELGCNYVRTSHYPQSPHFIDRCDEVGLLVFTEIPGWQHIGGEAWKEQVLRNVEDMVLQYRNHPSIILWGVRINESQDDDELYQKTNDLAHKLDPTRQTGGVRCILHSHLLEDVYTYNDFLHNGETAGCKPKSQVTSDISKPYMITEYNGHMFPTKAYDTEEHRLEHALRHARVLDAVAAQEDIAGSSGWCMFDYNTHQDFGSGDRICYHGVMDMFRNKKLAGEVYAAQADDPPMLSVSSSMDIGEHPAAYRGRVYAFTNADCVRLYRNDRFIREFRPEESPFPHLPHPPLEIDDFLGDAVLENEHFPPKQAEYVTELINYAARFGYSHLPLILKIKTAWLMLRYGMRFSDAYALYNKYTNNWGDTAVSYRFDAVKDRAVTTSVTKEPVHRIHLEADASCTELVEGETYDAALIRISMRDQNGNTLPFCHAGLILRTEGPIGIIGPETTALRGGLGGTMIRSMGREGSASLTIIAEGTEPLRLEFSVKYSDCRKGAL